MRIGQAVVASLPGWRRWFQKDLDEEAVQAGALRPSALILVGAQLGLLLLVMRVFRIEESFGLLHLIPLIFGGFLVHALIPLRYRQPFFLGLSLVAIAMVLGVKQGVGLIGLGLALVGVCHLPVAFSVRVALLVAGAAVLAGVRGGWIGTGWSALPTLVIPVLGAMFMFRLVVYLYDLRHETKPASLWERLTYFFMLPNVCFLLFPVVDYQTFRRTYYDGDAAAIYQKGVLWMYRGVVHLLLYRLVYYHFIPNPADVASLGSVVQSMLATYLLYLRISGQFHLIIGIMCLFGFNLPETHHLYYLASSFNDYWRRINIYWKDFMMKIFYYPSLMRLRRWGMTTALVGGTLIVFAGTWILHSYQWFWLRGTFPITGPDALFWGILGGLVVVNSLYEMKRSRKRKRLAKKETGWDVRAAAVLSLKTVGMFAFITVLWSLWSSPSVGAWVALVAQAGNSSAAAFGAFLAGLAALVGVGILAQYALSRGWTLTATGSHPSFARSATVTSLGTLTLLVVGLPQVQQAVGGRPAALVASLQQEGLNLQDELQAEQGYYEGLLNAEKYTSALMHVRGINQAPEDWGDLSDAGVSVHTGDLRDYELIPLADAVFKRAEFRTNRWGMRDKEYEQAKPSGTYRVALLGASHVMGAGVGNGETFESVLEERVNAELGDGPSATFEILNFAVGGHGLIHQVALAEERAFAFEPDAVFYVVHPGDAVRTVKRLASTLAKRPDMDAEALEAVLRHIGVTEAMPKSEIEQRLDPVADEIVQLGMEKLAALCSQHGARPALVLLPLTLREFEAEEIEDLTAQARRLGYTVLDLSGAYQGHSSAAIHVAEWDSHPNVLGHQLVADRLHAELIEHAEELGLDLPASSAITAESLHPEGGSPTPEAR